MNSKRRIVIGDLTMTGKIADQFFTWMEAHDRFVLAEGWDEGALAARGMDQTRELRNPYRSEGIA